MILWSIFDMLAFRSFVRVFSYWTSMRPCFSHMCFNIRQWHNFGQKLKFFNRKIFSQPFSQSGGQARSCFKLHLSNHGCRLVVMCSEEEVHLHKTFEGAVDIVRWEIVFATVFCDSLPKKQKRKRSIEFVHSLCLNTQHEDQQGHE